MFKHKRNTYLLGRGRRLTFPFVYVAVLLSLLIPAPANAQPTGYQEYYVLGYEEHAWRAFLAINDDPDPAGLQAGNICSTVSLVATADHQVVYYDHWEDGYEADLLNPIQSTTEVYGDGGTGNGGTGSDVLLAGDDITLTSDQSIGGATVITASVPVSPTRDSAYIRYDGGDRIMTSGGPVDLAHAMWPLNYSWAGGAWEVYSRQTYAGAYSYRLPIGEDLYTFGGGDTGTYGDFRDVYLQLEAFEDNTTVSIDNGTDTVNLTLDRGQTYFSMGYIDSTSAPSITIQSDAAIRSNNPTQVGLMTGADVAFQGRFFTVLPDEEWGADYVVPVPSGDYGEEAEVYLSNPNDFPISIQAHDRFTNTTFVVSPTTYISATVPYSQKRGGYVPADSAVRFTSSDGVFGVIVAADTSHDNYDWGFSGIPAKYLTRDYYVSWATGSYNTPPTENGSPVWVTPLADSATFYVDFSPLDGVVDQVFTLDTLNQQRIFDPDNDNTGMHVWATGEFAVAWGADPRTAGASNPYLDLGLTTLPLHEGWLDLVLTLDKTAEPTILPPDGGAVTFTLLVQAHNVPLVNVDITDTLPVSWTYVTSSTLVTYPDSSTGTPEPAIDGQTLFWDDLLNSLDLNQSLTLTFQAQITTAGGVGATAYDGFESGDYSGGQNWASDWQEWGDDGNPGSGHVYITTQDAPFAGNRHLHIRGDWPIGNSYFISRTVDLSDFTLPTLRFMRKVDSLEGDEYFYLDIYNGSDWARGVLTWTAESQQGIYVGEMIDLTSYASAATVIMFRSGGSVSSGDYFYADEIEIYDAAAINVNRGEAIGEHEYSGALFNPSDNAYVYISSLDLVKSVSSAQAGIGDTLVYTLSCSNASTSISATNVVLRDPIPIQYVTFQFASDGGVYSGASGAITWTLGTLTPEASKTVTFTVKVNDFVQDGATIKNTGYVNSDQTVEVGSNEVRTRVLAPGVEFTKSGPTVAYRGAVITYTLYYENAGGRPATAVTIQDTIPLSTTYVTGSLAINTGSGWITRGVFISPTLFITPGVTPGAIGAGEAGQIRYSVTLDDDLPAGSLILNSATLDRALAIPCPSNMIVTRIADLLIHKAAEQAVAAPGGAISYTLTYENGSETVTQTNVYLYEPIPDYTRFISGTAQGGDQIEYSWDNGATWSATPPITVTDIRWYDAELLTCTQKTVSFTVQVNDSLYLPVGATIWNMAHISSTETDQYLYERIPSNRVEVETVGLWIEKGVSQDTARAGEPISYTISYGNHGSADVLGAQIADTVPTGTNYITDTIWGTGKDASGAPMLVWDVMTVTAGASERQVGYAVILDASLPPGTLITNTAAISSVYGVETSAPRTVTVTTAADLVVTKSDNPGTVVAGTVLTYTLVYTNDGPSDAQGVAITDTLPVDVTYGGVVSAMPPLGVPTQTGQLLTWYTPTLAAGDAYAGAIVFIVTVDADATGAITNSVIITSSTPDPSPSNNTASESTNVTAEADLSISKSDDPDPVYAGSTLTYTLNIGNAGPSVATGVTVADTLPDRVKYGSASDDGWSCNHTAGVVTCNRSGLAVGAAPDIIITVTAPVTGGIIANTASIGAATSDPNATNNFTTAETLVIANADLSLSKTATPSTVSPGQTLTYTLTYTNQGPGAATGVIITDVAPITLTNVGYTASGVQVTPTGSLDYVWQVADLAPGGGGVIVITGVISPALITDTSFTNDAIIATSATTTTIDTNPANNDGSASTTVNLPRVSFSNAAYNVNEGAGPAIIMVTLDVSPFVTVTVGYTTSNGSAIAGDDYTAVSGALSFTPGIPNLSFAVPITDDALVENDETVLLTLSDPIRAVLATPATATLTITDDDTAGVNINPTTVHVTEDGITGTYQVVLTSQPTATVTITFTTDAQLDPIPALTFDDTDWYITQTVTVSAVDDVVVEGTPHFSAITHTASSDDANYDGITPISVTVNIDDNDSAGVSINPTIVDVIEGGVTGDYQVTLTSPPTAAVTITFATDAQLDPITPLTFTTLSWNSPQTVTVSVVDDDVAEGAHTSIITHTASSDDANYDGIVIADVTVNIADDDIAGVTITESGGSTDVIEGGAGDSYTVVLDSEPIADVTITFNTDAQQLDPIAPLTFDDTDWYITQTVTVSAVDDDVDETTPHNSAISHAASSADPNYAGDLGNVGVNITDNDAAGVTISESDGSTDVIEGGAGDSYTVVLDSEPTALVTVTFATDAQLDPITPLTFTVLTWNSPQTVTVSAVNDEIDETTPHTGAISHAASSDDANYEGIAISGVTVSITDDDTAGVNINPTTVYVTEGGITDIYQVVLTSQPTAIVTVTFSTDAQQLDPIAPLTFDDTDWYITQTVTVSAVDDEIDETTPHTSTISHAASSDDADYDGIAISGVTVSITDDDTAGVNVNPTTVSVSEGGATDTYQVVLTSQPTAIVTVTFAADAQLVFIAPLTFTPLNWSSPQTVTVSAVDDDVDENSPHYSTINHTASSDDVDYDGIAISDVTVSITDDDTAGVDINPTTACVSEGGITDIYRVVLTSQPNAIVTINFATDAQLDPIAPLAFTPLNWNSPRAVTVSAVDDDVDETTPHTSLISHVASSDDADYDGITPISDVTVSITDNDTEADLTISKSDSPDPVVAGNILTYTLAYAATAGPSDAQDVTIIDMLPSDVAFGGVVSEDPPLPSFNQNGQQLTWYMPTLAVGASGSIIFTVTVGVDASGIINNSVVITSTATDSNPSDNDEEEQTTVSPALVITKTALDLNGAPLYQGEVIEYRVVARNVGSVYSQGSVIITDPAPTNTTLIKGSVICTAGAVCWDVSGGGAANTGDFGPSDLGGMAIASIGKLDPGDVLTMTFRVTVQDGAASVGENIAVTESSSQSALESDPICPPGGCMVESGLAIAKSAVDLNGAPLRVGETVEYRIVVTNTNVVYAETNVTISDTLPANTTLVEGSIACSPGALCGEAGGVVTATTASLGPGDVLTLTFGATMDGDISVIGGNVAAVESDNQSERRTAPVYPSGGVVYVYLPLVMRNFEPTTVIAEAHLVIDKFDDPGTVVAGEVLTYTLVYVNSGPAEAQNVVITDTLPVSVTYGGVVTRSAPLGDPNQTGRQLTWYTPTLEVWESGAIVFTVTVNPGASGAITKSVIVTNSVIITSATPDPNPGANSDEERTIVNPTLVITKTALDLNDAPLYPSDEIEYRVMVRNISSIYSQTNVIITDPASTNTTIISGSVTCTPGATCWEDIPGAAADVGILSPGDFGGEAVAVIGSLGPGDVLTLTFRVTVQDGVSSIGGNVAVTGSDSQSELGSDPVCPPGGCTVAPGLAVARSVAGLASERYGRVPHRPASTAQAGLAISKSGSPGTVAAGEVLTYTLVYTNDESLDAQDLIITDTLPVSVTYGGAVSVTPSLFGPTRTGPSGGRLTWYTPTLAADASGAIVFTVTVDPGAGGAITKSVIVTNSAVITSSASDPNPDDNEAEESTIITTSANLSVEKLDSPDPVAAGTTLTYTLMYANAGPSDARGVTITDTLPVSVTYGGTVSVTPSLFGPTQTGRSLTWYTPTLAAGASGIVIFTVTVDPGAGGALVNSVVIASSTPDPDARDNSATTHTTAIRETDLAIYKTDYPDPVIAGTALTYTLVIANHGPSDATGVSFFDILPSGVSFNSTASSSSCTEPAPGYVTCSVGNIAANDSTTTTIVVAAASSLADGATLINWARVTGDETDPNDSNDDITEDTAVGRRADLELFKTGHPDPVIANTALTYTLVIANHGPSDATGVRLFDTLPGEVSFNSTASSPGCTEPTSGTIACSVGNIAANDSTTVTIVVTAASSLADGAILTNWAVVAGDEMDPNNGNNSASENTGVIRRTDLAISKTDHLDPAVAGTTLTYTLVYTNDGPLDAQNVTIVDTLPADVTYGGVVSSTLGNPTRVDQQLTWNTPALAAGGGGAIVFTVTVGADVNGTITNSVVIAGAPPELDPSDNDDDEQTTIIAKADLGVSKSGTPGTVVAGTVLTYTLVYTNSGPSDAQGVIVTDTLPASVIYGGVVSAMPPLADPNQTGQQITWYAPTLAAGGGGAIVFTVTVNIDASGVITNSVVITSAAPDPGPADNDDEERTTVNSALVITKTAVDLNGAPLYQGDEIEYLVVVRNASSIYSQTSVIITDPVPTNTTLISGSVACTPGATCWEYIAVSAGSLGPSDSGGMAVAFIESLGPGDVLTLTFRVTVQDGAVSIGGNIAVTESSSQSALESAPVCPPGGCAVKSGLAIAKSAVDLNSAPLQVGEVFEYRIIVTNTNVTYAQTNISISDTLPASTTLAGSVSCSPGALCGESGGVVTATIGSLGPGDVLTLTLGVTMNEGVSSIGGNVAAVESDDQGEQRSRPVYPPGGEMYIYFPIMMRSS